MNISGFWRAGCLLAFLAVLWSCPLFAADATSPEPASAATSADDSKETRDEDEAVQEKAVADGAEPHKAAPAQEHAWQAVWIGQREMIKEMRETAIKLSDSFSAQTQNLSHLLQPFEEDARRLLVFANTFRGYPNPMEAVSRRMGATITDIDQVLKPVSVARAEAEGLLQRVTHMADSLPDDVDKSQMSEEMRGYIEDITRARLRLTAVLAQYDSLLPSLGLVTRLETARKDILAQLPDLWENYYLQGPIAWLDPDNWVNLRRDMYYSWQAMILRLPVELPGAAPQWGMAIIRFFIGLFFAGILCAILRRRLITPSSPPAIAHAFKVSLPWLIFGFAFIGAAITANGDFFRLFLALGSGCLLIGQVYVAWDLRRVQYPEITKNRPPFLKLMPLAFGAYLLMYLPLTAPLVLVLWAILLSMRLLYLHRIKPPQLGPAKLEGGVLECETTILWTALFIAVSGLQLYSMALYLAYAALAIALELSLAGMNIVSTINEHLPQEGVRAAMARLLVALAAPFVLVVAVAGICLWVAILPGGTYLMADYAFKGISVGATQFNIIQALLIISAFYLTRTIVAMGTRFLARMPQQGIHFDATLITPMQTFLTYATWAAFGLFVLRSLGVELNNLAMVAGGLSVGIGFGMQNVVNNFISGLILIFGRSLQVGDVVEVGGLTGRVRKISVRATMVETYDNAVIYVPNSEFMAGRLINWTSFSRSVRRSINVGVAYGSDTEKVIKILIDIAKKQENVLKYPVPNVVFNDFGSSTLDFQLRFWVKDYDLGVATMSDIRLAINSKFNAENIEIAYPQLDVHLKDRERQPQRGAPSRRAPRRIPGASGAKAAPFKAARPAKATKTDS